LASSCSKLATTIAFLSVHIRYPTQWGRDLVVVWIAEEQSSHASPIFCGAPEEKGNALKLAWKADLIIDCVRGIWTQCKDLKGLHERFWEEPNIYFAQYDVLVCTTVIGAGFSIDSIRLLPRLFFVGVLTLRGRVAHASSSSECSPSRNKKSDSSSPV
jgi:hypothetical protein